MQHNVNVSLNVQNASFLKKEVSNGNYNNVDEIINEALQLFENHKADIKKLKYEIELGEQSGFIEDFDPIQNLHNLHKNIDYIRHLNI